MFKVYIDENSHYADENERRKLGEFISLEEAVNVCKSIVDEFLQANYTQGMTAEELFRIYTFFGEDPFIIGTSSVGFCAWDYAKMRCQEIAQI